MKGDGGRWGLWASGIPPPPLSRLREHNAEKKKSNRPYSCVFCVAPGAKRALRNHNTSLSLSFSFKRNRRPETPGYCNLQQTISYSKILRFEKRKLFSFLGGPRSHEATFPILRLLIESIRTT